MSEARIEKPAILMAGGRGASPKQQAEAMAAAFEGLTKPSVAYIGTANGDNRVFFEMMRQQLKSAGAGTVKLVSLAKAKADVERAKAELEQADVVYLGGGEVEDGIVWLERHGLVGFLRELYASGKPFIGVSAGTIMLGSHWVHWDVEGDDDTSRLFDCLNIVPRLFDVHGESEDWVELKCALRHLGDGARGYGLPIGCVIAADSQGSMTPICGEVLVFANQGGQVGLL